ncbi:hypothetical protein AAGS61_01865 [Lysinibacillus sp. KU-BSD001]|uniref:hypothetical protein n=1 Tax=Lysinibacillus sp. KU-BSD001 TaxID=3141328 RepID=UPI0036E67A85
MPIINNNEVQVIFGTGDISVGIGCKSDKSSSIVQFTEIEPRPIGEEFAFDKNKMEIDDAPVTFIFNKIESLDAVIYQLQRLRDLMANKDNYQWTDGERILEKNPS